MNYIKLTNEALENMSEKEQDISKKYLKFINSEIDKKINENNLKDKLNLAIALGLPYFVSDELDINILDYKEFYEIKEKKERK